jgi:hypothetical protein
MFPANHYSNKYNIIKLHSEWSMNQMSINIWNPSTHTSLNWQGTTKQLYISHINCACSPVHHARLTGRNSSHRSFNQLALELRYRKYNRSDSLSLGGLCILCPTNCANLCAYWNRKHGGVTKCFGRPAHQALWTMTSALPAIDSATQ